MRLDIYLVENSLFESREKARVAIKEGNVLVNKQPQLKPSFDITEEVVEVVNKNPYVSRGGYKLEHAINEFNLDFNNKVILDIGASTGGFTDVSLQKNATKVYSVDVGSNQLHQSLLKNPKVISLENTNILDFETSEVFDYLVMDVSFVSLKVILPDLLRFLNDDNQLVALIKPQYEIGKVKVKNGIVKDLKLHEKIINDMLEFINNLGLNTLNLTKSPITGKMGNVEYLVLISKNLNNKRTINIKDTIYK